MRFVVFLAASIFIGNAFAAEPEERIQQEVHKALIQRDQQAAEFAAGANRPALEALHRDQMTRAGQPLNSDPLIANQLRPYERERMARERDEAVFRLPPPHVRDDGVEKPRPLPGGPEHGVEPVAPASVGG